MQYIRLGIFKADEVIPHVILNANKLPKVSNRGKLLLKSYIGYEVKMNARNLQLFALKGCKCVNCGVEGTYFALETQFSDWPERYYCLNLYTKDGTLFTKDHIIPKAAGGSNALANLQPMCINCNAIKADKVNQGAYIKGALKLESVSTARGAVTRKGYRICMDKAQRATRQTGRPLHPAPISSDGEDDDD